LDGEGRAYQVRILSATAKTATGKIIQTRRSLGEPVAEITLAQSVLKGDRFDWLVEKCTELGVRRIIPLQTETTIVKATPPKRSRWRRIAIAAMKQSGRTVLPEISPPKTFLQVIAMGAACKYRLIAHAGGESLDFHRQEDGPRMKSRALLVVGPEGGFTEEEIARAKENGFTPIGLGPRRLRSETAGVVLSTLLLSHLGELS